MSNNHLLGWSNPDATKNTYFDVCNQIVSNENMFASFKRNKAYTRILEHVDYNLGLEYANIILNNYDKSILDLVLSKLDEIKKNDAHGSPEVFSYDVFGVISPTTLRYIKVLMDILSRGLNLDGKSVAEIGGGYGGQCLVLSQFFDFESYTIFDLKPVTKLQKKYLNVNNVDIHVKTIDTVDVPESYDFVISNYAFAELNKKFQDLYLDLVIRESNGGYFQINPDASECYKRDELMRIFSVFRNADFFDDAPMNRRYPNNFTFVFGE